MRLTPPTVDQAPVVNEAPLAVVPIVNCPFGKKQKLLRLLILD
jgi:hypothetical protein